MRFLALKIAFLGAFENDNILSSKSYTVTKSAYIILERSLIAVMDVIYMIGHFLRWHLKMIKTA